MSGDQRREQILQTAVSLFSNRGFSGTTTKEIAPAAGVSEAMVFKHFASKDVLFAADERSTDRGDGGKGRLRGLLRVRQADSRKASVRYRLHAAAFLFGP